MVNDSTNQSPLIIYSFSLNTELWKKNVNSDGRKLHKYHQQYEQSPFALGLV